MGSRTPSESEQLVFGLRWETIRVAWFIQNEHMNKISELNSKIDSLQKELNWPFIANKIPTHGVEP